MNSAQTTKRIKAILTSLKTRWSRFAAGPAGARSPYLGGIAILAALPAIAGFSRGCLLGHGFEGMTVRVPIDGGTVHLLLSYLPSLLVMYVATLVMNALTPPFDGRNGSVHALKVVSYPLDRGLGRQRRGDRALTGLAERTSRCDPCDLPAVPQSAASHAMLIGKSRRPYGAEHDHRDGSNATVSLEVTDTGTATFPRHGGGRAEAGAANRPRLQPDLHQRRPHGARAASRAVDETGRISPRARSVVYGRNQRTQRGRLQHAVNGVGLGELEAMTDAGVSAC